MRASRELFPKRLASCGMHRISHLATARETSSIFQNQKRFQTRQTTNQTPTPTTPISQTPSLPTQPPKYNKEPPFIKPPWRTEFNYSQKIYWYPQHQTRALRQLQNGIHQIDVVVEVRDARIPLTSKNPKFDEILGRRPRLIVYNKADLANSNMKKAVVEAVRRNTRDEVVFTQADKGLRVKQILEWAKDKCKKDPHRYPFLSMVIVGLPNVGKSSLINALRRLGVKKGKASAVGPSAGVTQTIQTRVKIYDKPAIYLVDTPGIFDPHITHPIEGLKIALTGATKDRLTEEQNVADYLLFRLNNSGLQYRYPSTLGISGISDDVNDVLSQIARNNKFFMPNNYKRGLTHNHSDTSMAGFDLAFDDDELRDVGSGTSVEGQGSELDLQRAARHMITLFREGKLGAITLDDCSPAALDRWFRTGRAEPGNEDD